MATSTIKAVLPRDIKTVWEKVTSPAGCSWRSDLERIEVTGENTFTEYDKDGYALDFTVTVRQPCARWEFDFENENIRGHWTGIFRDRDGISTEVEFTETARAKKFWMKPFVKAYLKKQQRRYLCDLKKALDEIRDESPEERR